MGKTGISWNNIQPGSSALSLSRSARSLPGAEYGASRQLGPAGTRYTLMGTRAGKEWEGTDRISGKKPSIHQTDLEKYLELTLKNILEEFNLFFTTK